MLPSSSRPKPGLCATSQGWPSRSRKAPASQIVGNSLTRNFDDGIDIAYPGVNVTRNRVWFNVDLGIEAVAGTLGGGNWAKHNVNPTQCVPSYLCTTTGKP
jgi:hypothetical protein